MTVDRSVVSASGVRAPSWWSRRQTAIVFGGALIVMVAAWGLLALLYGGLTKQSGSADVRGVISAVTGTTGTAGAMEARALLATPEYFAIDGRGAAYFGLDPERSLEIQSTTAGYFNTFDRDADALSLDPRQYLPVMLMVDVHEGTLDPPEQWVGGVRLENGDAALAPIPGFTIALRSEHHQTVVLQFPRRDPAGHAVLDGTGRLTLTVPRVDGAAGSATVSWGLPLRYPDPAARTGGVRGTAATLGALVAIVAGLLVVFSPCAVHMTAYFLPLVTGLGMQEILDRRGSVAFRAHVASLGLAFVSGFVVLYTLFGVGAGFAGQLLHDTTRLQPFLVPLRILTGAVVMYMALRTLGVFRLPFVLSLGLPGRPHERKQRSGYIAAAIAGMSISVGCLTCVGGSLLATLLLYAGASSSPLTGGLTLFLFAVGMSMPFLLAALAFDRVVPRFTGARTVLRYSTTVAGAVMVVVALLIISGNDSVFEQLVFRAL